MALWNEENKEPCTQILMAFNFHTHTNYCDGKGQVVEYVQNAKALTFKSLGISSHAPLPFTCTWCMKDDQLTQYLLEIESLKDQFPSIEIYTGLEVDYIPGISGPGKFKDKLDYTIGSVHFVDQLPDGRPWEIDGAHTVFLQGLREIFSSNIKEAVSRYFELTRQMVRNDCPTIIGHLDKIKIQNTNQSLFVESENWYRQQIILTLDEIKKSGAIVEVNTRGLYQRKSNEPYPGIDALTYCFEKNIPITLNSDAHHPEQLIREFLPVIKSLVQIGFRKAMVLYEGRWQAVPLTAYGT